MSDLRFTVYCHPEPQGSSKAFVIPGTNRASVTSTNTKLKPYRHTVAQIACETMAKQSLELPWAAKHVPVSLCLTFYFEKPPSVAKKRTECVVKPDIDKICRSTFDALTGVLFKDDAQVVEIVARKQYGTPERVEIICQKIGDTMRAENAEAGMSALYEETL
jgi:crossover junction endodeoxyribonuclease RusA